MTVRALAGALVVAAVTGMAACSGEPTALETGPILGSWTLVEIDGEALPISEGHPFQGEICTFTLHEFNITFRSNRRYTGNDVVTRTCPGFTPVNVGRNISGRWRTAGDILFVQEGEGVEAARQFDVTDSTLTITADDNGTPVVQVLIRQ